MTSAGFDRRLERNFLLALFLYFGLHILLRVLLSPSLDYDEAEQALLGQWLRPGYTEQPPLYTWMQYLLFALFGKNVFAISLLKNGLLLLTYWAVFLSGREIFQNSRAAVASSLSLLLIPQIGWESQRDMTHTTLVVFAAAGVLLIALRLLRRQSLLDYILLGILLGTGVLAKSNFLLFVAALFAALLSLAEGRRVVFRWNFLASILIAAAMAGVYLQWVADNQDILFSTSGKFKRGLEAYWLKGPTDLLTKIFLFLTPLWLVWLILFPGGFCPRHDDETGPATRLVSRYLLVLLPLLLMVVLLLKVTYVKDRWLQPLLFVAPLFFFSRLGPGALETKRFRSLVAVAGVAATAVYVASTVRVAGASFLHSYSRVNYPIAAIAASLRKAGFDGGLIVSDDRFLAGNLHFQFPESSAIIPGYRFETLAKTGNGSSLAVVWKADRSPQMPASLPGFVKKVYGIDLDAYPVHSFEHPYLYAETDAAKIATVVLRLPDRKEQ